MEVFVNVKSFWHTLRFYVKQILSAVTPFVHVLYEHNNYLHRCECKVFFFFSRVMEGKYIRLYECAQVHFMQTQPLTPIHWMPVFLRQVVAVLFAHKNTVKGSKHWTEVYPLHRAVILIWQGTPQKFKNSKKKALHFL